MWIAAGEYVLMVEEAEGTRLGREQVGDCWSYLNVSSFLKWQRNCDQASQQATAHSVSESTSLPSFILTWFCFLSYTWLFPCHVFLCFFSQTQILATLGLTRLLCREKCSPMFYTWQGNYVFPSLRSVSILSPHQATVQNGQRLNFFLSCSSLCVIIWYFRIYYFTE